MSFLSKSSHGSFQGIGGGVSLSIGGKIWLGMGILVVGYAFSMLLNFTHGANQEKLIRNVSTEMFPVTQHTQQAVAGFDKQTKLYMDAVMMGEASLLEEAQAVAADVETALADVAASQALQEDLHTTAASALAEYTRFTRTAHSVYTALSGFEATEAHQKQAGELAQTQAVILAGLEALDAGAAQALNDELASITAGSKQAMRTNLLVFVCVLVVASVVVWIIVDRMIQRPIRDAMHKLQVGSEEVGTAVKNVAESSHALARDANDQAAQLQSTVMTIDEISNKTKQNASNAQAASSKADNAHKAGEQSMAAMTRMGEAIDQIKASSDETAKIVKTIDEIAFQTNLLALNAAVEAARAGDAGKGFAVVAEEVRNLAQRSAEAARTTAELIDRSQDYANRGVDVSTEVSETLSGINQAIEEVTGIIGEVAGASNEQADNIAGVTETISRVEQVTQSNAASAEEWDATSSELNSQAAQLKDVVLLLERVVGSG